MRRWIVKLWFLLFVRPIVRLVVGVNVAGRDHLSVDGPAIIIANHNSHLDAAVLMDLMPMRRLHMVRPVAAADYYERSWIGRFVFRHLMNSLPIRRDRVTRNNNPLRIMTEALDRGHLLILFPEGTRGEPERLSELRTGIAHLIARRPDVPVIPVFLRNLGLNLPRGDFMLVPMFCDVYVGRPRRFCGSRDQIMEKIRACLNRLRRIAERDHVFEGS